jgi:hypothetical protein
MVELKLHSRLWELTGRGTEGEAERSKRHVLPCSMERHHWGGGRGGAAPVFSDS